MLNQEPLVDIHALHQQGQSIWAITRKFVISRNTVRSYLRYIARTPKYWPILEQPSNLDPPF